MVPMSHLGLSTQKSLNFIKMVAVSERPTEALRGEESSAEPTASLRQLKTGRPYGEMLLKSALTEWQGRWRSRAVHAVDTAVKGVGMVWAHGCMVTEQGQSLASRLTATTEPLCAAAWNW